MNFKHLLSSITYLIILFLACPSFSIEDKRQKPQFKEELSFSEDQTWYTNSDWKNGFVEVIQCSGPGTGANWQERIDYFISRLRKGDRKAFLYVHYDLLDGHKKSYALNKAYSNPTRKVEAQENGVLWELYNLAKKRNTSIVKVLTKGDASICKKVVRAVLNGLFNKDPRVRLVTTNLLRRLGPDLTMARDVKRSLIFESTGIERYHWKSKDLNCPDLKHLRLPWGLSDEDDYYEKPKRVVYLYIEDRDRNKSKNGKKLYYASHSPWEELKKLDLFITRAIWVDKIKKGDVKALKVISIDTFRVLTNQIDRESLEDVPLKSPNFKIFGEAEARGIIVGMLENRDCAIREECFRFLKRFFERKETSLATKGLIKKAFKKFRQRKLIGSVK